jgi:hypothetical protein
MRTLNQEEMVLTAAGADEVLLGEDVDDSGSPVHYQYDPLPPPRGPRKFAQVQAGDDGGCTNPPRVIGSSR